MGIYKDLMALGAENCHPRIIAMLEGKKQVVGQWVGEDDLRLTDAGRVFLTIESTVAAVDEAVPEVAPKPRKTKPPAVVDSLDLDLN